MEITTRELSEIKHALLYFNECGHGTVGHNMLVLIAKMAKSMGFLLEYHGYTESTSAFISVVVPDGVTVESPVPPPSILSQPMSLTYDVKE